MARSMISNKDVVETFIRASGPGGQNVNKVATCVQLLHRPTGIVVKCRQHRTQHLNRRQAWQMLNAALERQCEQELLRLRQAKAKKRRQNRRRPPAAKERILAQKKEHSFKKQNRKGVTFDE